MENRTRLISWPVEPQGAVAIYRENNGTYTVEHALGGEHARVFSKEEGFKTFKAANREAKYFRA